MGDFAISVISVGALVLGYGLHKLIRRFINPKASVNHMFLFFLAHFVGIFMLVFLLSLLVLKFGRFLFQA